MKNLKTNSSLSPSLNENPGAVPLSDTVQGLRAGSFKVKDTFYFSHDYNARSDEKIKRLIRKHGLLGYGIFWAIIEDLYNNANALHTDYEGIAYDLHTDSDIIKSVINDFDLFVVDNGEFGSLSVEKRLDARNEKSEKARESAFKRWNKDKEDADAMRTHSEGNAKKERKGKENKGNDIKEKENKTVDELKFEKAIIENYSQLLKMKEPLTYDQHLKLVEKYGRLNVDAVYKRMHNWPDLCKKNVSANLTARKFMKDQCPELC